MGQGMWHGITSVLLVALGGALGGMARLAISTTMARMLGSAYPWGTLLVNASGALVAGGLLGLQGESQSQPAWLFTVAGLLGGYTTVSSFSLQTLELWQSGQRYRAVLNMVSTLLLGVALAALGWQLVQG